MAISEACKTCQHLLGLGDEGNCPGCSSMHENRIEAYVFNEEIYEVRKPNEVL